MQEYAVSTFLLYFFKGLQPVVLCFFKGLGAGMAFFYLANFTITSPTPAAALAFPATIKKVSPLIQAQQDQPGFAEFQMNLHAPAGLHPLAEINELQNNSVNLVLLRLIFSGTFRSLNQRKVF